MTTKSAILHSNVYMPWWGERNLKLLMHYLQALPDDYGKFDMGSFFKRKRKDTEDDGFYEINVNFWENHFAEHINECGTVACMVGHGPLAGLEIPSEHKEEYDKKIAAKNLNWDDYIQMVFGFTFDSDVGQFLFSGGWSEHDNTIKGGCKRLFYVLDNYKAPSIIRATNRGFGGTNTDEFRNITIHNMTKQEAKMLMDFVEQRIS